MKIREGLVFKSDGSTIIGFVAVSDMDNLLKALEASINNDKSEEIIADHMLTNMVRGIFIKLSFPLASFPTRGIIKLPIMLYFSYHNSFNKFGTT